MREHYEKQGLLRLVNAEQPADDVFADVCVVVAALQAEQRQTAQAALEAEAASNAAAVASGGACTRPLQQQEGRGEGDESCAPAFAEGPLNCTVNGSAYDSTMDDATTMFCLELSRCQPPDFAGTASQHPISHRWHAWKCLVNCTAAMPELSISPIPAVTRSRISAGSGAAVEATPEATPETASQDKQQELPASSSTANASDDIAAAADSTKMSAEAARAFTDSGFFNDLASRSGKRGPSSDVVVEAAAGR